MMDLLTGFGDAILGILKLVISFVADIVYVIKLLLSFIAKIPEFLFWLPTEVVSILGVIILVVVIYKIMGREG